MSDENKVFDLDAMLCQSCKQIASEFLKYIRTGKTWQILPAPHSETGVTFELLDDKSLAEMSWREIERVVEQQKQDLAAALNQERQRRERWNQLDQQRRQQ